MMSRVRGRDGEDKMEEANEEENRYSFIASLRDFDYFPGFNVQLFSCLHVCDHFKNT